MRRAGVVALVAAGLLALPASASAFFAIDITGAAAPGYNPDVLRKPLGATFVWTNQDSFLSHTVTQGVASFTPGPALFDSNAIGPTGQFQRTFIAGGTYLYFCKFHPTTMTGKISIPDKVSPGPYTAGTALTLQVATVAGAGTRVYDAQKRVNGGAWTFIKSGTTLNQISFTPGAAGTYQFRSRVRNTSTGAKSAYSPALTVSVT